MNCRAGCGACCIAPSISSPIPGMPGNAATSLPKGKPAGVRCVQLDDNNRCLLFGDPRRPTVCSSLRASVEMCGPDENVMTARIHAMKFFDSARSTNALAAFPCIDVRMSAKCLKCHLSTIWLIRIYPLCGGHCGAKLIVKESLFSRPIVTSVTSPAPQSRACR